MIENNKKEYIRNSEESSEVAEKTQEYKEGKGVIVADTYNHETKLVSNSSDSNLDTNDDTNANTKEALTEITDFFKSEDYKRIKKNIREVSFFIEKHRKIFETLKSLGEDIQSLAPFLKLELEENETYSKFRNYSLIEILTEGADREGNATESKFKELIERARERWIGYESTKLLVQTLEQTPYELPRIIINSTDKVNYPLDKPNSVIWNLLINTEDNGQMRLNINTSKNGDKKDVVIYYGINFDELENGVTITKHLTPFDKRCYIATAALFNAGNDIITATQIYSMMGNSKKPGREDLRKVNESLTKMGAARVYIDNIREIKTAKGYKHFKYDAALLPFERITAYINGQLTDSSIHLFREPPLISFAKQRKQITTLSRKLLESPISKTDANLRIDDYLLERIGHMKSGRSKSPRKMLLATIYKQCGIITAKQKQRAPEKIRKYLEHYKKCKWIKGYKEETDGITIEL